MDRRVDWSRGALTIVTSWYLASVRTADSLYIPLRLAPWKARGIVSHEK
eukprot:COSAG06_NODE_291_length_18216_cov_13.929514_2_plen_49_part_00